VRCVVFGVVYCDCVVAVDVCGCITVNTCVGVVVFVAVVRELMVDCVGIRVGVAVVDITGYVGCVVDVAHNCVVCCRIVDVVVVCPVSVDGVDVHCVVGHYVSHYACAVDACCVVGRVVVVVGIPILLLLLLIPYTVVLLLTLLVMLISVVVIALLVGVMLRACCCCYQCCRECC